MGKRGAKKPRVEGCVLADRILTKKKMRTVVYSPPRCKVCGGYGASHTQGN